VPYQLTFQQRFRYDSLKQGITLDVTLARGSESAVCAAKVDTGAQLCLFEREIAEGLEIDVEHGFRVEIGTLAGTLVAFGHEITLQSMGLTFHTVVYFPLHYNLQRNILGRQGWLQLVRLAVIDYDGELYLSPYDE
jgi:hypothetical protein